MSGMTTPLVDPRRMLVAVHELAHAVLRRDQGIAPASIRIKDDGRFLYGIVEYPPFRVVTAAEMGTYVVGALAGDIAGNRWRDVYAPRLPTDQSEVDAGNVRWAMRQKLAAGLDLAELRGRARDEVTRYWAEITRLAPRLATVGSIRL